MSENVHKLPPNNPNDRLRHVYSLANESRVGDSARDMSEDGIAFDREVLKTTDSAIAPGLGGMDAVTTLDTGTYGAYTTGNYDSNNKHLSAVRISRDDGKGGEYRAKLTGDNAEKAADIIRMRTAKKIGPMAASVGTKNSGGRIRRSA